MSAFHALDAARAAGIEVRLDGKDLVLSGASAPPTDVLDMLRQHKLSIVEHLQAVAAGSPTPPARPRGWSAADWRLFHNDRQLVAEIALGHTRGQARVYAFVRCVEEWRRVRPGSSEAEAIAALAVLGITDPTPPPPARHLPPAAAGVIGADTGVTGPTDITAPQQPQGEEWSAAEWMTYYAERAAIAEHDCKLPRPQAEARAFQSCVAEWLDQHPVSSKVDDGCVICGATDRPNDSLLPVGIGSGVERVWLHRDCVPAWRQARVTAAVAALAELGIRSPEGSSP